MKGNHLLLDNRYQTLRTR